ncbi:hypothetical protein Bca4012_074292 [Brassica carinata]|uniref:(rape) hypothetical protein n=1 Tax=Brassica napus TaxID=3708 RepID=A0A078JYS4_BRANA|nr:unnamed protein product [Brassica napus]CDY70701.1 BnaCnng69420D [Brassica napus]
MSMAKDTPSPPPEVPFLLDSKNYRFTAGTKAKFAVSVINRKPGSSKSKALYIEAAKEGEEPISFGDGASLVSYRHGWRLKTVIADSDLPGRTEKEEDTFQRQFPSFLSTVSILNYNLYKVL